MPSILRFLTEMNILLEPTIFSTAVSGEVPGDLGGNLNTICGHCIVPKNSAEKQVTDENESES